MASEEAIISTGGHKKLNILATKTFQGSLATTVNRTVALEVIKHDGTIVEINLSNHQGESYLMWRHNKLYVKHRRFSHSYRNSQNYER